MDRYQRIALGIVFPVMVLVVVVIAVLGGGVAGALIDTTVFAILAGPASNLVAGWLRPRQSRVSSSRRVAR